MTKNSGIIVTLKAAATLDGQPVIQNGLQVKQHGKKVTN